MCIIGGVSLLGVAWLVIRLSAMRLLNALYQITYPKGYPMPEKNTGLMYTFAACLLLIAGFGVGYIAHTPPEPIIEMTVHGLFVNGKHVDLDSLKFKLPVVPDKGKEGKRKPGDLPAGQLGPAAKMDGAGLTLTEDLFVMWYGDDAPKPAAKCPCSPCDCGSCACHLVKPAVQMTEQRGSPKSPELFGIESLVNILKDFKEAIFGSNGKPGLRDDIAGGLRDFYGTLRTGVIVAGGCVAGWMLWVGASLHKIANKA